MKKKLGTEKNVKSIAKLEHFVHTYREVLLTNEIQPKDAMKQLLISFKEIVLNFSTLNEELLLAKDRIKELEIENEGLKEKLSK
jgi:hypothetical protein